MVPTGVRRKLQFNGVQTAGAPFVVLERPVEPYMALYTQPSEPILFPKLRIHFAVFS